MLTQQTFEKLCTMKLNGMTDAFGQQQEDTEIASLSFEERFGLLVDQQWIWKENRALARCLAGAKFKLSAAGRRHRLPSCERSRPQAVAQPHQRAELSAAASQHFSVRANRHWKSYLACALARKACRDGFTALYRRAPQLFRDLAVARADGSLPRRLPRLARLQCPHRRRLGHGSAERRRTAGLLRDRRRPLSEALDHSDQPVAGRQVACPDRVIPPWPTVFSTA